MNKQKIFEKAIHTNDINTFKSLINDRVFIAYDNDAAIRRAVTNCNYEMVKLLLESEKVDPSKFNSLSLYYSVTNNYIHIAKLLLKDKRTNPAAQNNYALYMAFKKGYLDIIDLLWKDKRVKDSLQEFFPDIYTKLKTKDVEEKMINF